MTQSKILTIILFLSLNGTYLEAKKNNHSKHSGVVKSNFIKQKISQTLYILKSPNYNTNVGVFIGDKSILVVDPMTGQKSHKLLLNEIKTISSKPIKYVLNTHSHIDHSGANTFFADRGATIISQENAKYSRAKHDVTFENHYIIDMGNEKIELIHIAAHTFDDALIYFTNNNAIFMGDTFMTNSFPHFYYGGGGTGHLTFMNKAMSIGDKNTLIIPAHGKLVSNKQELRTFKQNSTEWINQIAKLHRLGKTSNEIITDDQIQRLSNIFNNSKSIPTKRFIQTIEKTISADLIPAAPFPIERIQNYEGEFSYPDGKTDEIILLGSKLILRQEGAYIFEIAPISERKFHIKGQPQSMHITFDTSTNEFVFYNGKESLKATRNK